MADSFSGTTGTYEEVIWTHSQRVISLFLNHDLTKKKYLKG